MACYFLLKSLTFLDKVDDFSLMVKVFLNCEHLQ